MKIPRDSIRFLLLEGVIVVLSVLLALFLEDWRQERELDQRADAAVERVLAETLRNRDELADLRDVVTERRDRLGEMLPTIDGSAAFAARIGEFGGYRTPDLVRAAWDRANAAEYADRLPEDFLRDFEDAYSAFSLFSATDRRLAELTFDPMVLDPAEARMAAQVSLRIMNQQVIWARNLVESYDELLRTYGSTEPPDSGGG